MHPDKDGVEMEAELVIPGTDYSPVLRFYINPLYNLYHYLAKEGQHTPPARGNPALAAAAVLMGRTRFPRGTHGAWDGWESEVALGESLDSAVNGMSAAMIASAEQIGRALREAEAIYI